MNGYIKLHRKLLGNCIAQKPEYLALWVTLLMMANYQETTFIWNNEKQTLKAGQLLTGIKKLSAQTGIAQGTVYRILKYLENEKQIEIQTTPKYSILTIISWELYQQDERINEKQNKNRLKTDEKQIETYKNDKNEKNEKNNIYIPSKIEVEVEKKSKGFSFAKFKEQKDIILQDAMEKYPDKNCEKAINTFIEKNEAKNYKYTNYRLAFFNWVREDRFGEYGVDNGIAKNYGRPRLAIN